MAEEDHPDERDQRLLGHVIDGRYRVLDPRFQLAESCTDKREPFELLKTLKDVRAMPVLVLARTLQSTVSENMDSVTLGG